jgi:putative MATE family efflux protein
MAEVSAKRDFSKGPVWKVILAQGLPLTLGQLVQLLYNVVDRIYLGHIEEGSSIALTGVGLTFPVITLIMAFTALFGSGGIPLFSIARGAGDVERAKKILGTSFALLLVSSVVLTVLGQVFCCPILFMFGASEESYIYAESYLRIYLAGTTFSMLSVGLSGYINAQGFPGTGMLTTVIGAAANIILDPVFIFALDMGVAGAAIATVISQALSCVWVLIFLTGKRAILRITAKTVGFFRDIIKDIMKLGTVGFIMQGTTFLVQGACNSTLQTYGGDLYVGIMTVLNSIREIFMLPLSGVISGSQPVIGFNYGAKRYDRVKTAIKFNTIVGSLYMLAAWLAIILFPRVWFSIFSNDAVLMDSGIKALRVYFFGFVFMALQVAGQSTFQGLGYAKHAIFFSLLRKVVIVLPLTLILPRVGLGIMGVFMAEPISNAIGGIACYTTMMKSVYRKLGKKELQ